MAKLIVIEGADQTGKYTQSNLLHKNIQGYYDLKNQRFITSRMVEVPTNDIIFYKTIYWMLGNGLAKKYPTLFQTIHFLNKLVFMMFVLPYYYLTNDYIIFDRWKLSGYVYGQATGMNRVLNKIFYSIIVEPDITFVLSGKKMNNKVEDSFEKDNELQSNVRILYKEIGDKKGYSVIDCNQDKEVIQGVILEKVLRS